jgi:hypothetical protein
MNLQRYEVIDEYSLKELILAYESSDSSHRIELLESLYANNIDVPFEVATRAVQDSSVQVRRWFAANAKSLDYNEKDQKDPERDLTKTITEDTDPFVKASLFENSNIYHDVHFIFHSVELFTKASHLERLALVRNPAVSHDLIEKIFNFDDGELSLSLEQRKELALAYLTNPKAQEESRRDFFSFSDGWEAYDTTKHYRTIYDFILKWPKNSFPLSYLFKAIDTDDSTKARFYKGCEIPFWRRSILANCKSADEQTLQLGMKDSDADCRLVAFSKVRYFNAEQLESLLSSNDQDAIWGLAGNENLPIDTLYKVRSKLEELHHDWGVWNADATIEKVQMKNIKKDPQELFSATDEANNLLRDKVDFIGRKILALGQLFADHQRDTLQGKLESLETQMMAIHQRLKEIWIAIIVGAILFVIIRFLK